MRVLAVTARWDAESRTWWTDGEDVPGLCCQGGTFEELSDAVFALANRITVLVYGRVIASDVPAAIRSNEEVRRAYLGEQHAVTRHG